MLVSPVWTRPKKGYAGDVKKKLKLQNGLLVGGGAPHQQIRNWKIGLESQMGAWHEDRSA
jgi:hypothetical protein